MPTLLPMALRDRFARLIKEGLPGREVSAATVRAGSDRCRHLVQASGAAKIASMGRPSGSGKVAPSIGFFHELTVQDPDIPLFGLRDALDEAGVCHGGAPAAEGRDGVRIARSSSAMSATTGRKRRRVGLCVSLCCGRSSGVRSRSLSLTRAARAACTSLRTGRSLATGASGSSACAAPLCARTRASARSVLADGPRALRKAARGL